MLDRPMSKYHFKFMILALLIRYIFCSPKSILTKVDMIRSGACVLDYGSGPGKYAIAAAGLIGPSGKVYGTYVKELLAIPEKHDKLVISLRTAQAKEYSLDKEQTNYDDSLDALRLSFKGYSSI